jgi:protein-tyrosine phosphatase
MSQPVSSASPVPVSSNQREQVTFSAVSLFHSRIFKMLATAAVLTVSVVWILPAAASQWGATLDPLLIKSLLGAILVGVAAFGLWIKKELYYEISFLYTIFNSAYGDQSWWSEIDKNIVLGALPLHHQMERIKDLGITHVISVVEPFELEPGIVRPIQPKQWEDEGIVHKHIVAKDFVGVPQDKIDAAVKYMAGILQNKPNAKFYIHCKAGRGRSTTIVLCFKMKRGQFTSKEIAYAHLKNLRTQINLNDNQMDAAQTYINSPDFNT